MSKLVTVLMSVHNEKMDYLMTAIHSICTQTYRNIEFLIIDDASDLECHEILEKIVKPYPFVKLIRNEINLGITKSLYLGVNQAQGDYIARMDADDFSLPQRLEKQVCFLEENPQIDIVGGGVVSFGAKSVFMSPCQRMHDSQIKSQLFFTSAFCHPAVMIRKSFLVKHDLNYNCNVNKGQDYDLWERSSVFGSFAILKDIVLYYRLHDKQISVQNRSDQDRTAEMVMKRRLGRIGLTPSTEEYTAHLMLKGVINYGGCDSVDAWVEKLIKANEQTKFVERNQFKRDIRQRLAIVHAKQKRICKNDMIPLLQHGMTRIVMAIRLRIEKRKIARLLKEGWLS